MKKQEKIPPKEENTPSNAETGEMTKEQKKQAIMEHLNAMRHMIMVIVIALVACFALLYYLCCQQLTDFILAPLRARDISVVSIKVSESLMMQFKTCFVAAVICAMPVIIWQVWAFVAPALYPNEKRMTKLLACMTLLLFILGVLFAYYIIFPLVIDLFYAAGNGLAESLWSVKDYFDFVLSFVLPFGLMFELPVIIFMLARHGKVTYASMAKSRRYFVLGAAVAAAVLTPPDIISQCMLLAPLLLLYEISIQIARLVKPVPPKDDF